jgi:hypothetical protein
MSTEGKLTIGSLLVHLRQRLIDAREKKDSKVLNELGGVFDLIEAAAWEAQDRRIAAIAEEMWSAVRDTFMGSEWKSNLPSVDDIEQAT